MDEKEAKEDAEKKAKEDAELAEIDKPPKTAEFWTELRKKIEQNDLDFVKV